MSTRLSSIGTTEILWGAPPAFSYDLKPGMVTGTGVSYDFTVPANTFRTTATGAPIKIENPDRTGTITATFETDHELFDQLMIAIPLKLVGVFTVYQAATKRRWSFKNATIITDPGTGFGTDAPTFQLMWFFESLTFKPGSTNPANILGS